MSDFERRKERKFVEDCQRRAGEIAEGRAVIATYRNSDSTEGRGPMVLIGLFSDFDAAQASREGHGIMGRTFAGMPYIDTDAKVIAVFDSFEAYALTLPDDNPTKKLVLKNNEEYAEYLRLRNKFGE